VQKTDSKDEVFEGILTLRKIPKSYSLADVSLLLTICAAYTFDLKTILINRNDAKHNIPDISGERNESGRSLEAANNEAIRITVGIKKANTANLIKTDESVSNSTSSPFLSPATVFILIMRFPLLDEQNILEGQELQSPPLTAGSTKAVPFSIETTMPFSVMAPPYLNITQKVIARHKYLTKNILNGVGNVFPQISKRIF